MYDFQRKLNKFISMLSTVYQIPRRPKNTQLASVWCTHMLQNFMPTSLNEFPLSSLQKTNSKNSLFHCFTSLSKVSNFEPNIWLQIWLKLVYTLDFCTLQSLVEQNVTDWKRGATGTMSTSGLVSERSLEVVVRLAGTLYDRRVRYDSHI